MLPQYRVRIQESRYTEAMKKWYSIVVLTLLLALQACSTPPPRPMPGDDNVDELRRAGETPASLLRRAASARGEAAAQLRFQAAELLVAEGDTVAAQALLTTLDDASLPPPLRADIRLLRAVAAGESGQPARMLELLAPDTFPALETLDSSYRIRFHRLRAQALAASGAPLDSALERIRLDRFLSQSGQENNHQLIWDALASLPPDQLEALAANAINFEVRGWFELALLARRFASDLDRQLVELGKWQDGWVRHPAARILPGDLQQVQAIANTRPNRIALLLPLQSTAGLIVRDAFLGAYYSLLELGGSLPQVRLYDTSSASELLALYQQAVQEGAEMVIGPLLKEEVAILHQIPYLPVPTLALNNVEGSSPASPALYQFSLSPEDEGRQTARQAWSDGHRRVAILHPAGETRRSDSFTQQWLSLGGEVAARAAFQEEFTETISALLELNLSNARHRELDRLLGRQTLFQPRRRQDIDFIYLVASPASARQIVPSLAYLYAGDIPVYASQEVYSGVPRPVDDRDLNGVVFGESPWVLQEGSGSADKLRELFPLDNGQALRLQAFGVDAFRLYPRLNLLDSNPELLLPGATGMLRMGENRNIVRHLLWATIRDGLAQLREPVQEQAQE